MSTLRVLSIDMDFFQDADVDTLVNCYPDGRDLLSPSLAAMIWSFRYSTPDPNQSLRSVKCPEDKLEELTQILLNQDKEIPVLVAQSHLRIYNFIRHLAIENDCTDIDIVNIDMHHDMFTDAKGAVDCGNWVNAIRDEFCTSVKWISHPASSELFDDKSTEPNLEIVVNDFSSIQDNQFDAIFLCRSDMWFAPHLDSKFNELARVLVDNFNNIHIGALFDRSQCTTSNEIESLKSL